MKAPRTSTHREPTKGRRKGFVFSANRTVLEVVATKVSRIAPYELGGNPDSWNGRVIEAEFSLPSDPPLGVINSYGFGQDVPLSTGHLRIYRGHGDDRAEQPFVLEDSLVFDVVMSEAGFAWLWGETMARPGTLEISVDFPTFALEAGQNAHLKSQDFLMIAPTEAADESRVNLSLIVRDEWKA